MAFVRRNCWSDRVPVPYVYVSQIGYHFACRCLSTKLCQAISRHSANWKVGHFVFQVSQDLDDSVAHSRIGDLTKMITKISWNPAVLKWQLRTECTRIALWYHMKTFRYLGIYLAETWNATLVFHSCVRYFQFLIILNRITRLYHSFKYSKINHIKYFYSNLSEKNI